MKKIYLIFLFILFFLINTNASGLGDIDNNGKIGAMDYILLRKHIMKLSLLSDSQKISADMNKDGNINAFDYVAIRKRIIEGKINPEPLETPNALMANTLSLEGAKPSTWKTSKHGSTYEIALNKLAIQESSSINIWYSYLGEGKIAIKSSNEQVATVIPSTTGEKYFTINAIKSGEVNIIVTVSKDTKYEEISIEIPVVCYKDLKLTSNLTKNDKNTIFVTNGEKVNFTLSNLPAKDVIWKSSNTSIATIDANGILTATGLGKTTVTATFDGKEAKCDVIVLSKNKLINVNKLSYHTYMRRLYTGSPSGNFQNFGFVNLYDDKNEYFFQTNKYTGKSGKEQVRVRVCVTSKDRVTKYNDNANNNILKYTVTMDLYDYYSHGQSFDIALSPNRDKWLMFFTATTEPGGTQYLRVFDIFDSSNPFRSGRKSWKDYPNLKGQPSIDLENDLIAMVSGTTCKIYKYSDLINNDKETLLYSFSFSRYTTEGGKYYTNGFAIKDGYLYEIRGESGDNGIEVWDYSGSRVNYRDIPLLSTNTNEPQGIHIYGGKIFIGLTEFGKPYSNDPNWTYTVGYLE